MAVTQAGYHIVWHSGTGCQSGRKPGSSTSSASKSNKTNGRLKMFTLFAARSSSFCIRRFFSTHDSASLSLSGSPGVLTFDNIASVLRYSFFALNLQCNHSCFATSARFGESEPSFDALTSSG